MPQVATSSDRFIRTDEVYRITGYKRSSIDRFIRSGKFPAPAKASGALLFSEQAVLAWMGQHLSNAAVKP